MNNFMSAKLCKEIYVGFYIPSRGGDGRLKLVDMTLIAVIKGKDSKAPTYLI